jgi:hypothetical protein
MKLLRIAVGLAFWSGIAGVLWAALARPGDTVTSAARRPLSDLWHYYTTDPVLELRLPAGSELAVGDPVLAADAQGSLQQVGIVRHVANDARCAEAALFRSAPQTGQPIHAYYLSNPDTIEWVVRTLLPPARRKQIQDELAAAVREHHQEVLEALRSVVEKGVRDALAVLKQDLPRALEHHRPEIEALAARYQTEIIKGELAPLVKEDIWPIVRRDSEPTARQVGNELWERVSLWRFAWRGVLDRMPLIRGGDRVEMELQRFLDEEAVPILQSHEADYQAVVERIVRDVADNERVQASFRRNFARVARDPELRRIVNDILQEAVVKNPRFWEAVRQNVTSSEAQEALRLASERLEPTVRHIGDLVLGTRENGLTPEFTRVLRQQILFKDRQAIVIGELPRSEAPLPCTPIQAWFSDSPVAQP